MTQAFRFALDPTPAQQRALVSHAGASRFAWNWGLAACQDRYAAEGKWWSAAQMHKRWNAIKKADPALAWWEENGTARILSATVARTAHRWHVSFTVEIDRAVPDRHARPGSTAGIDLGVKTLLTVVDDHGTVTEIPGAKALHAGLRKLRRLSRAHSRKAKGSANRAKAAARLARRHARITNVRNDALHKATSTLAQRYETLVVEDLNVTGMVANRRLARAVADAGFGQARRMLAYKTGWCGGRLVVADRWYPSSKTCSGCGGRKPSLSLSERTYRCDACGLNLGRDVNAAINLRDLAASGAESRNACGGGVRPGRAGRPPVKQEPGTTPRAGQAGAVAAQAATA
ncbi:RNA-guided endonuclease InsQ/TnpB family protein [Actinomadura sp. 21ATH]|uniref:RNA-guided endonuclease InsQ/TnpB family protein n=1 Tax=Actinomadura sp. 21ATH TaxID=1735444 RepID=UPI0035BF40D4